MKTEVTNDNDSDQKEKKKSKSHHVESSTSENEEELHDIMERSRGIKHQKDSKLKDKQAKKKVTIFGSLEAGDKIEKIEFYKINDDDNEKVFKIYWRKRKDGVQPKTSFMEYEMLKS